jgi:hypothetical protein
MSLQAAKRWCTLKVCPDIHIWTLRRRNTYAIAFTESCGITNSRKIGALCHFSGSAAAGLGVKLPSWKALLCRCGAGLWCCSDQPRPRRKQNASTARANTSTRPAVGCRWQLRTKHLSARCPRRGGTWHATDVSSSSVSCVSVGGCDISAVSLDFWKRPGKTSRAFRPSPAPRYCPSWRCAFACMDCICCICRICCICCTYWRTG